MTIRKSHTPFPLVPKSTTMDDLERPICILDAEKMHLSEPTTKIWMKIDPYYQRQKCRPMTRFWRCKIYADIRSLTPHPTHNRSFRRRSSQPITWLILTNKAVQENKHTETKHKYSTRNKHAKTKYKSDKVNNLKNSKTKLPWFSRLLRHSARKRGGLIL